MRKACGEYTLKALRDRIYSRMEVFTRVRIPNS